MTTATPTQLDDLAAAIAAVDAYVKQLLDAQHQAALNGDLSLVLQLTGAFNDANTLEERLVAIRTMSDLASLKVAITSVKQATATLDRQKKRIDATVKAVGTAADVLSAITKIVTTVAKL